MLLNENLKITHFENFYKWLKNDGLLPKKSERLHKKKIFQSLLNDDEMTIDNFKDYLEDHKHGRKHTPFDEISQKEYRWKFKKAKAVSDEIKKWLDFTAKIDWLNIYYMKDINPFTIKNLNGDSIKVGWHDAIHPDFNKKEILLHKVVDQEIINETHNKRYYRLRTN